MVDIPRSVKIAGALVLAIGVFLIFFVKRDYTKDTQRLDSIILKVVKECGVGDQNYSYGKQERGKSGGSTFFKITRRYEIGADFKFDTFQSKVTDALSKTPFKPARSTVEKDNRKEESTLCVSFKNRIVYEIAFLKKKYKPAAKAKGKGAKIAIVLDDFGYNMNNTGVLYAIKTPLTISILPNLPYSKRIAEEAAAKNLEVILHLPLEPRGEKENIEKGTIMTDMPPKQVRTILANALTSVPGVKGVSNHMGSKATENKDLMKVIFDELSKRHLYFMDNLTADDSVCEEVAGKSGIHIATRSVFLDNELDEGYIENQIRHTAEIAEKTGSAVGVGHDRPATVRVLSRIVPELKNAGFQFVYLSELVR
jgi:uncharacterized protein